MHRTDALRMVKRRAIAAGLPGNIGCHTCRTTGITSYLQNGGSLEHAMRIACHESARTTKLYDRTSDEVSLRRVRHAGLYRTSGRADRLAVVQAALTEWNQSQASAPTDETTAPEPIIAEQPVAPETPEEPAEELSEESTPDRSVPVVRHRWSVWSGWVEWRR